MRRCLLLASKIRTGNIENPAPTVPTTTGNIQSCEKMSMRAVSRFLRTIETNVDGFALFGRSRGPEVRGGRASVANVRTKGCVMPQVTVNYEMFLPGGHHRQPRNTSIELNLAPTAGGNELPPGPYTPPFFPELPYTFGGGSGLAQLLFWSVTDGTQGQVLPPAPLNQTIGSAALTITAR